jgi:hypothetical protein
VNCEQKDKVCLETEKLQEEWEFGGSILKDSARKHTIIVGETVSDVLKIREAFEIFVDLRLCATVMQREAVNVMPVCSGGGNVVVA